MGNSFTERCLQHVQHLTSAGAWAAVPSLAQPPCTTVAGPLSMGTRLAAPPLQCHTPCSGTTSQGGGREGGGAQCGAKAAPCRWKPVWFSRIWPHGAHDGDMGERALLPFMLPVKMDAAQWSHGSAGHTGAIRPHTPSHTHRLPCNPPPYPHAHGMLPGSIGSMVQRQDSPSAGVASAPAATADPMAR